MGIIRLLLSLAVVGAHCNSNQLLKLVGGETAVQIFYIISGFYMSMIISTYETKGKFWISRYLRLYPLYIICALMSLTLVHGINSYAENLSKLPISATFFLILTNATIFLQDIAMFLGVKHGELTFVSFYGDSTPPLFKLLLLPQGWSLGIELTFYTLAPFILKKSTRFIILLIVASELVRIILIGKGFSFDPWTYRFFPSELSIFLIGSLAYKYYNSYQESGNNEFVSEVGIAFILLFIISFPFIPLHYQVKKIILIISFALLIGKIFHLTKNSSIDNFIGMLSYPVYVSHLLTIQYFIPKLGIPVPNGSIMTTAITYFFTIVFSFFLYYTVERPVDLFRHRFKKGKTH